MTTPNSLHNQVTSLPELVRTETWRLEDELRKVIPTRVQHSIRHIILTGSGDSAIAGTAAEHTFRKLVGVPALATTSLQASRYDLDAYDNEYPHTPLLIATSNSGEVARVVEAAHRAKSVGGYVVGLTGDKESRLGQISEVTVNVSAPSYPSSPGMRSYVMAVLALNLFAIRFAEVRGRITMDEAQALRGELASLGDAIEEVIASSDTALHDLAGTWSGVQGVEFLGAGPSFASAAFGSAKILEATGKQAAHIDLEEFVHLNYFERAAEQIGTVVFSPHNSAASSRAAEIAPLLTNLRRPWLAVGDIPGAPSTVAIPEVREEFAPVVQAAVAGLLAAHLMDATGEEAGRGAIGQWSDCVGGATTRESALIY